MNQELFNRFCNQYPEYCNEALFNKLFGGTLTIEALKKIDSFRGKARGIIASISKRETKTNKTMFSGEVCDKTGCIGFIIFGDDIENPPKVGDDVIFSGFVREWKGKREVVIKEVEVIGNIYTSINNSDSNENRDVIEDGEKENGSEEKKSEEEENEVDNVSEFLKIMREALSRGAKIKYDKALSLMKKLGLSEKDVEKYIEVYEDNLPNSLEKAKFVRLKEGV